MKKYFSLVLLPLFLFGTIGSVFAADTPQKLHHYTIIAPDSAKVGEAIDVTVEARDKDDKVITSFRNSIFFQASDYNATLPSQGRAIQFTDSDAGVKKFSKAVVFKKVGDQSLEVSDAVEDVTGKKTIRIDPADATSTSTSSGTLTIITPQNNETLDANNLVTVSGYAKKNSKVNIKLNGTDIATAVADDNGLYTKTLPTLTQQSNVVTVESLDGTNTVTSTAQVRFSVNNSGPTFQNLVITPGTTVEASSDINLMVEAEPGLSEVTALLDGSLVQFTEGTSGKYTAKTVAPANTGSYAITLNLKNTLSQGTSKPNAATLTVTPRTTPVANTAIPRFSQVRAETQGKKVTFTFGVENDSTDLKKFKIVYGENADSLSEQVLTKNKETMLSSTTSGAYTWYIDNLPEKTLTFKIFGMKDDQNILTGVVSDPITTTIGKAGCTIANVGAITVKSYKDKSVLSWTSVTGAISYNVYRLSAAKDPEFIQNTKDPLYTLYLSTGSLQYQDFWVKALCDDKTESADVSKASKVRTGPAYIALFVIISALLAFGLARRRAF